jgi:hypothetical protein
MTCLSKDRCSACGVPLGAIAFVWPIDARECRRCFARTADELDADAIEAPNTKQWPLLAARGGSEQAKNRGKLCATSKK